MGASQERIKFPVGVSLKVLGYGDLWAELEIDIYAEQTGMKGPIPSPEKYVDQSYLRQALKELGLR
jgi:hypothetical protein